MCFDDRDTYTTSYYVRNGQRYYEEQTVPRFGMSRRRRYGLGGSYYPSRYYTRPPHGRHMGNALTVPARYPQYGGYPRGVLPGGHSRAIVAGGYPRGAMPGGFSYGYGQGSRYFPGARAIMPGGAAMVSLGSFLSSPIALSLLPLRTPPSPHHWRAQVLRIYCRDDIIAPAWATLPPSFTSKQPPAFPLPLPSS
ncbi:Nn.00g079830.m01.CDS01 [Neocucurbitaria sp. VM-36]